MADCAYLAGERGGGKRVRGSENKVWFMAAVEFNDHAHLIHVRFVLLPNLRPCSVNAWASTTLEPAEQLVTDGLRGLAAAAPAGADAAIIVTSRHSTTPSDLLPEVISAYQPNLRASLLNLPTDPGGAHVIVAGITSTAEQVASGHHRHLPLVALIRPQGTTALPTLSGNISARL